MFVPALTRMSLIVGKPRLSWKRSQVVLIESLRLIKPALSTLDIERIILDRCASADEFLHLLAVLPPEVAADVMLVRQDGGAFLSATGRGGDRVMYTLAPHDVDFYIETHGLTVGGDEPLALTA